MLLRQAGLDTLREVSIVPSLPFRKVPNLVANHHVAGHRSLLSFLSRSVEATVITPPVRDAAERASFTSLAAAADNSSRKSTSPFTGSSRMPAGAKTLFGLNESDSSVHLHERA